MDSNIVNHLANDCQKTSKDNTDSNKRLSLALDLCVLKTNEIQNNVLDLMSTLIDCRKQHSINQNNKVLVKRTELEAIEYLIPKLQTNTRLITTRIGQKCAENESLKTQLNQCLKRENCYKKQLEVVRSLYRELKDEMDWNQSCDQIMETIADGSCAQKQESIKSYDYLKVILSLIWNSTQNETIIQSFIESEEEFRKFMEILLNIIQTFVSDSALNQNLTANQIHFDSELIDSICGICVNIFGHKCFRNNEFVIEGINQWIDSLIAVNQIDIDFNQNSLMVLYNISFSRKGMEALVKRNGFVLQLAYILIDSRLKFNYGKRSLLIQLIHHLIHNTNNFEIRLKFYKELIQVLPINAIQNMIVSEPNPRIREDCAQLLASIGHFATNS